jgi:propanediol dehydratase large subunit
MGAARARDVCADAARAYIFGVEEATDNVSVLSDAVSVVVSVVVGGVVSTI